MNDWEWYPRTCEVLQENEPYNMMWSKQILTSKSQSPKQLIKCCSKYCDTRTRAPKQLIPRSVSRGIQVNEECFETMSPTTWRDQNRFWASRSRSPKQLIKCCDTRQMLWAPKQLVPRSLPRWIASHPVDKPFKRFPCYFNQIRNVSTPWVGGAWATWLIVLPH